MACPSRECHLTRVSSTERPPRVSLLHRACPREAYSPRTGPLAKRNPQRNRVGHMSVRHMCATGLPSNPSPSSGCLKLRPSTSSKSSSCTTTFGSNEYRSLTQISRELMYHL